MVNCDFNNAGCNGGWLSTSVNYLVNYGVVSNDCLAYASGPDGLTKKCTFRCDDKATEYKKYGCKFNSVNIMTSYDDIREEIMTNGPVMVGFIVYDDFMSLGSGIYEVTAGSEALGGHAVMLTGWGFDSGRLYWIAQNQWGTSWGDSGYFNIYAGESGIDLIALSCLPDIE